VPEVGTPPGGAVRGGRSPGSLSSVDEFPVTLTLPMPEVSQRTFGKLITALSAMYPSHAAKTGWSFTEPLPFWRTKLFEYGFPDWLPKAVAEWHGDWTALVPHIHSGWVYSSSKIKIGEAVGHSILVRLIAMVLQEPGHAEVIDPLRRSLQLDGFEFTDKLIPISGLVSADSEKNVLLLLLKQAKIGRKDVITKHIEDAEDLFTAGKYHPAINEGRNAFQAVIEEVSTLAESKFFKRSGAGLKNQVEFLEQNLVLSADERSSVMSAWGFLSSGSHPGLSQEQHGRIGTIFSLEFCQMMLLKSKSLL
jgi:hypothetical protein